MWFVYMLLCDQKTFYIGISDNLPQRYLQHKNKLNISTKKFSDLRLVYAEQYLTNLTLQDEKNNSKVGLMQRSKC